MSPIGRVFIVLNLILAGAFVGFSGSYLQKQDNFKKLYEKEQAARTADVTRLNGEVATLTSERGEFERAKIALATENGQLSNAKAALADENKLLQGRLDAMEGDVKQINAQLVQANQQSASAFDQSKKAYELAFASDKAKDEAIRVKNETLSENRTLKDAVASLEDTVKGKDLAIASITKDLNENKLLVQVATTNGFIPGLVAPPLAGTVSHASGNLCTISITNNPSNVDIQDQINKRQFTFGIYDASGYKGEAVATEYHAKENAVTCNLILVKGDIKAGDKASTKTP